MVLLKPFRHERTVDEKTAAWEDMLVRQPPPRIPSILSPQQSFRKRVNKDESGEILEYPILLKLDSAFSRKGNNTQNIVAACNSPDVKSSALPTLDSRCFQSIAYEQQ